MSISSVRRLSQLATIAGCLVFSSQTQARPELDAPVEVIRQIHEHLTRPASRIEQAFEPVTVRLPRFVYVEDVLRSLPAPPWGSIEPYGRALDLARRGWIADQGDNVRALMVITTFDDGGDTLFYVPLANDIEGLGIGDAAQIFDDTPNSPLDGSIWMGSLDALDGAGDLYFTEAFVHEIAHRWSAYLEVDNLLLPQSGLLGRQEAHWSFLAHTEASPMEGNDWRPRSDNRHTTYFEGPHQVRFSPLDLYTMGVLPEAQVPPFGVIYAHGFVQPSWYSAVPSSEPAHRVGVPVTLSQTQVAEVAIADIVRANGARRPAATNEVLQWPVGVVLLSDGRQRASVAVFRNLSGRLAELENAFEEAAGQRIDLQLDVVGLPADGLGAPCDDVTTCIRTEADRCAPPESGSDWMCTRLCATNESCGTGFCCMNHTGSKTPLCAPRTEPCPVFSLDAGGTAGDGGQTDGSDSLNGGGDAGCACSDRGVFREPSAFAWLWLAALIRRRRSRLIPAAGRSELPSRPA